jgi:hypothetical protein
LHAFPNRENASLTLIQEQIGVLKRKSIYLRKQCYLTGQLFYLFGQLFWETLWLRPKPYGLTSKVSHVDFSDFAQTCANFFLLTLLWGDRAQNVVFESKLGFKEMVITFYG